MFADNTTESRGHLSRVAQLECTIQQQHTTIQTLQSAVEKNEAELEHHDDRLQRLGSIIKQQNAQIALLRARQRKASPSTVETPRRLALPEPRVLQDIAHFHTWEVYMDMVLEQDAAKHLKPMQRFWYIYAHLSEDLQEDMYREDLVWIDGRPDLIMERLSEMASCHTAAKSSQEQQSTQEREAELGEEREIMGE